MKGLVHWLDQRTGCATITKEALYERIPGGSRWRYVWGSTLVFAFFVQIITGLFLWMAYNPGTNSAWESVYYIQYEMTGGWLLRGLHHYVAQVMNILLVLHLMQVVVDGAYRAPREVNFWTGIALLVLVLALSLTGYLLPWDEKGYWATKVTTNIVGITPFIGPYLQKILIGGAEYGHHTLTRFFAFHAGFLPALVVLLVVGHIYLFRRHGITAKKPIRRPEQRFWPDQLLKDSVAALAVLVTALLLVIWPRLFDESAPLGVPLGAPADPSEAFDAARPEWYFLFLFQFLKYQERFFGSFPGNPEVWAAVFVPGVLLLVLFLMPLIGRWRVGHWFNVLFSVALLAAVGMLTYLAISQDRQKPDYLAAVQAAGVKAERVKELVRLNRGAPPSGALTLLRQDPLTQGPKLFAAHCSSCHLYEGHNGLGITPVDPPTAADLKHFPSREWLAGFLDPTQITNLHYFGGTAFADGKMARFVQRTVGRYDEAEKEALAKVIVALSAQAQLPYQADQDLADADIIQEGRQLLREELACTDCHQFIQPDDTATAPDLTAYGSRDWMMAFISDPAHERFYGDKNDRMPSFAVTRELTPAQIGLIVDWLRQDWPASERAQPIPGPITILGGEEGGGDPDPASDAEL